MLLLKGIGYVAQWIERQIPVLGVGGSIPFVLVVVKEKVI
jgi:hypothetical protein